MAGSLVQSVTNTASPATTATFASTPTAGNFIVVLMWSFEGSTSHTAPSDNKGNTYNAAIQAGRTGGERCSIWYAFNISSSATFTVTAPGGPTNYYWQIQEWAGMPTTDSLDKTVAVTTGGASPTATTAALSQADEVAFAVVSGDWLDGTAITVNSGWTQIAEITSQAIQAGEADYWITSATTALTASYGSMGSGNSTVLIATFKAAAGGLPLSRIVRQAVNRSNYF